MSFIKDPFFQRMLMTAMAIGCAVLAALLPTVRAELIGTGTALLAWAHLEKPGSSPDTPVKLASLRPAPPIVPPAPMFPVDISEMDGEPDSGRFPRGHQ